MILTFRCLWLLLLAGTAVACIPKELPPPLVERVPYKILVHYSSDLPNPYYVLSGPFQSYQRFAFNDSFQRRLESYAAAKSNPSASQTLELTIHAKELLTTYDRIGILPEVRRPLRVAQAGILGRGNWPLSVFDSRTDGPFDDLPEQITKTATLRALVSITLPGRAEYREEITARSIHRLERQDMGLRTYDYDLLIAEVQTAAVRELDRLLLHALQRNAQH